MSRGLEGASGESWVGFVSAQDSCIRRQAVREGNAATASVCLYQEDAKASNEIVSEVCWETAKSSSPWRTAVNVKTDVGISRALAELISDDSNMWTMSAITSQLRTIQ